MYCQTCGEPDNGSLTCGRCGDRDFGPNRPELSEAQQEEYYPTPPEPTEWKPGFGTGLVVFVVTFGLLWLFFG